MRAPLLKDAYKVFHPAAYKPGVTHVHGNLTNRFGKYSNTSMLRVVNFGIQRFVQKVLIGEWEKFFEAPKEEAIAEYSRVVNAMLGKTVDVKHMEDLHDLGYLPITLKALPEGVLVPYGVPTLTVSTTPGTEGNFGWVTNMIETVMSAEIWAMQTAATTAFAYRQRFENSVLAEVMPEMIPFMGHDFSYRGMMGTEAASMTGQGHLLSFVGSDTIPAALALEDYYGARIDQELVFASVDATEHSVMCSYGTEGEKESLEHLMTNVTPTGILSVVSDTWDFWKLVTEYLVDLKETIMAREGTVVIRPDSGDPVKILTGYTPDEYTVTDTGMILANDSGKALAPYEVKGLMECLLDIFGGTEVETSKGTMKLLDSHIGAIYGDSITLERQDQIINRLEAKGIVPSVVLGIGSFTYQYVTRDTHGSAVKATDTQQGEGNHVAIFKDPKTDSKKKSAKGLLAVGKRNGEYVLLDDVDPALEASTINELKPVFIDGVMVHFDNLATIRDRINDELRGYNK